MVSVLDRLAGGGAAIERAAGAPYVALTTIDDVYPDRPDRAARLSRGRRRESRRDGPLDAAAEDVPLLLELFGELADYEQLRDELHATEEQLARGAVRRAPGGRGADRRARR